MKRSHRPLLIILILLCTLASCRLSQFSKTIPAAKNNPKAVAADQETMDAPALAGPNKVNYPALEREYSRCNKIIKLCGPLLENAETEISEYFPYETRLTQRSVDEIEDCLWAAGYPVINTDAFYPSYLENSGEIAEFAAAMLSQEDAELEVVSVSQMGQIYYHSYQYHDGAMLRVTITINVDADKGVFTGQPRIGEVLDWELTPNGDFCYRIYPLDQHLNAFSLIRAKPVDRTLHELTAEYIQPIGYKSNNMFLTDWSSADYGYLSFNDLFEYLYRKQYGDYLYASDMGWDINEDMNCYMVPSGLFEETILPFFDISTDNFRASALYNPAADSYPWQVVNCSNLIYFPTLTPEVVDYHKNDDGTLTLVVDVMCYDRKAFPLFSHEVTLQLNGENYQYLSNRITFQEGATMPPNIPRLEAQR